MPRPYRFGKVYAALNLVSAAFCAWLAADMLWYGYFCAAILSAAAVPLECVMAVGLWKRRRYGFYCLCLSFLLGIASDLYSWFRPSEARFLHRLLFTLALYATTAVVITYFYKRRSEFA